MTGFSWLQTFIAPFVAAFKGMFWHDTIALIIPPTEVPIDISYIPDPEFKALIIGLTFGTPREYDPATGTIGSEFYTTDVGIWHSTPGYMDWHWDPFVESIIKTNPYPQLLWASRERPYYLRVVNRTAKHIWVEATFWAIKFPRTVPCPVWGVCDPEDLFLKYMQGVTGVFVAASKVGPEKMIEVMERLAEEEEEKG